MLHLDGKYDARSNVLAREYCQCGGRVRCLAWDIQCHQPLTHLTVLLQVPLRQDPFITNQAWSRYYNVGFITLPLPFPSTISHYHG